VENARLRILLVGDEEDTYVLARDLLAQSGTSNFHLEWKSSYAGGLRVLVEGQYDVCLLDDPHEEHTGGDLLKEAMAKGCRCPIIFMTGRGDDEGEAEATRAGAADVLLKDRMTASLLERSIRYALERKRAEEARKLLAAAVDQGSDGVAITDPHLTVQQANPALEKISGYSREEIVGRDLSTLIDPGWEKISPVLSREALAADGVWTGRWAIKRKDGNIAPVKVRLRAVKDAAGSVTHFVAHCQDITREVEILEQTRRSQKAEALGTLAGGIAHEFNNLLSTIVVNTEMVILELGKTETVQSPLSLVLQAAHRGRDLVKRIIAFSRQTEQPPAPMKVSPVLQEALKFLRSTLPNDIEIREDIHAQPDVILGDPSQIHQILINLGNNAAYAMREEGGVLEVKLNALTVEPAMAAVYPGLEPGPYLRLTVRDTGEGMPPAVMERIFDPFFTTRKAGDGMGLGLSAVQGIVKGFGGTVTVYSEVGQGSTFQVFFPRIESEPKEEKVSPWTLPAGKKRILLVEDEELQLLSYRDMLERMGYRVTPRASSQEALSTFEADPNGFDLVVTDQTMPKMNGLKLAAALLEIRPDLPIILCTGFSETVSAEEARLMGVREFLMKPFSLGEIAEVIRRALQGPKDPGGK
jgi:PAS domain S-box-containing protein